MRVARYPGHASVVVTVRTEHTGHRHHAVAAHSVLPGERVLVAVNSWGATKPVLAVTQPCFRNALSLDVSVIEVRSRADALRLPPTSELYVALTPLAALVRRLAGVPEDAARAAGSRSRKDWVLCAKVPSRSSA